MHIQHCYFKRAVEAESAPSFLGPGSLSLGPRSCPFSVGVRTRSSASPFLPAFSAPLLFAALPAAVRSGFVVNACSVEASGFLCASATPVEDCLELVEGPGWSAALASSASRLLASSATASAAASGASESAVTLPVSSSGFALAPFFFFLLFFAHGTALLLGDTQAAQC